MRYNIIDRERSIDTKTNDVNVVIDYLKNYKDIDFRDWSNIMDDRLSYDDGMKNLKNILINKFEGVPFDWSYGRNTNKIIIKSYRELNLNLLVD
jgi:hypothetical protein